MRLSWRQRLEQEPRWQAFENWPNIPFEGLPRRDHAAFLRNQRIVADILANGRIKLVAERYGVTRGRVSQLLDRCLGGEAERAPALTRGLIPRRVLVEKQRVSSLPRLKDHGKQGGGPNCAFRALLATVPGLREGLDAVITAKLKDAPFAQSLAPQPFHREFLRILAENHWPADRYPYTTRSRAYEGVRTYLHTRTAELLRERQERRMGRSRGVGSKAPSMRALRTVQIDEHTLDLMGRVHLVLDGELIPLRLARCSVLTAVDPATNCVLGYYLAPTRHPNQQDLLTLIERCLSPWQPMALATPGLAYTPGGCFPSGLDGAFALSFGTVQLDNALMHLAQSVVDLVCEKMGATLSLGPPATPTVRHKVEAVFDYINDHCSHRFASTTGSYPTDPRKESRKNEKTPPVITFQTIDEALSIILTEHNVTAVEVQGGASPLALHRHQCENHFVRYAPTWLMNQWQPLIGSAVLPVHWLKHEDRFPHVNFCYGRYQGPGLLRVADKERQIRVVFDRRDIRTLRAFTMDGEDLGELQAPASWRRYPHSIATRQYIHRHAKAIRFSLRDPLGDFFRHLLDHKGKPDAALSLLRVYREFTAGLAGPLVLSGPASDDRPTRSTDSERVWLPSMANHREQGQ